MTGEVTRGGPSRVLKFTIPVDGQYHTLRLGAFSPPVKTGSPKPSPSDRVDVHFLVATDAEGKTLAPIDRQFMVFATGATIPANHKHVGSCNDGPYIWHVFERMLR